MEVFDIFFVRLNNKRFIDSRNILKHARLGQIDSCCLLSDFENGKNYILGIDSDFKILYFDKKTQIIEFIDTKYKTEILGILKPINQAFINFKLNVLIILGYNESLSLGINIKTGSEIQELTGLDSKFTVFMTDKYI